MVAGSVKAADSACVPCPPTAARGDAAWWWELLESPARPPIASCALCDLNPALAWFLTDAPLSLYRKHVLLIFVPVVLLLQCNA